MLRRLIAISLQANVKCIAEGRQMLESSRGAKDDKEKGMFDALKGKCVLLKGGLFELNTIER